MSEGDKSFHDNLDKLVKLLRKLRDKAEGNEIPGIPKMFLSNFDFVINNYEMMKNQISDQLLNQYGESIKKIVADMVEQLQEEVGEDIDIQELSEPEPQEPELPHKPTDTSDEALKKIDERLKQPGLSEEEIDRLLDERGKLKGS
jgi:hypothetical protein